VWTPGFDTVGPGIGSSISAGAAHGDPWTATHGGTGLEYQSVIGRLAVFTWCVAVAATDRASMTAG
jgi:hypothetical protein